MKAVFQHRSNPDRVVRRRGKRLVVGIGNPYRQDDGVGPAVIEKLGRLAPEGVELHVHSGEGAGLMELWEGYQKVIIVDATLSGAEPGTIYHLEAHRSRVPGTFFHYSTHAFGLAEAVELARSLGTLPQELIIYGIEGQNFGHGQGLSPPVEVAAEEVVGYIVSDLAEGE